MLGWNFIYFAWRDIFGMHLFESPWSVVQNILMLFSHLINYPINFFGENVILGSFCLCKVPAAEAAM